MSSPSVKTKFRRGDTTVLAVMLITGVAVVALVGQMGLAVQYSDTLTAWDGYRQRETEVAGIESIVRQAIYDYGETSLQNSGTTAVDVASSITTYLNAANASNSGVTFSLTNSPAVLTRPTFFPFLANGAFTAGTAWQSTAGWAWGGRLLSWVQATPTLSVWSGRYTFDRSLNAASNRSYFVDFQAMGVPISGMNILAYSLPGTAAAAGGGIPNSLTTAASSCARAGAGLNYGGPMCAGLSSTAMGTDAAVLSQHVRNVQASTRLPFIFRDKMSFCWSAADFLFSQRYSNQLLLTARAGYDFFDFGNPTGDINNPGTDGSRPFAHEGNRGGLWYSSTKTIIVYPRECDRAVFIDDPTGDGTVQIGDAGGMGASAYSGGQVIFVRGSTNSATGRKTVVSFANSSANTRGSIIIATGCNIQASGQTWNGALWLGPSCNGTAAGQRLNVNGSFAYCAAFPPSAANLVVTVSPASNTVLADMATVSPLQLVVATQTSTD